MGDLFAVDRPLDATGIPILPPKEHKPHSPDLAPGLEATLVVTLGPQQGLRYHLTRPEVKIGRRKDMDLILSDSTVSSEHARVYVEGGSLWVEDLRSLNGTLVNDRRIRRAAVQHQDKITVGKYVLEVEMEWPDRAREAGVRQAHPTGEIPAPAEEPAAQPGFQQVWVAGYSTLEREVLFEVVARFASGQATAFANGEELLTELSARLSEDKAPDLIILNNRMPLISGLNAAIAVRAFEDGFQRLRKIPIGFLGTSPSPESESFLRVMKFCQPACFLAAPARIEEFRSQALNLIQAIKKLSN